MTYLRDALAFSFLLMPAAPVFFFVTWHWIDFWRARRGLWRAMAGSVLVASGLVVWTLRPIAFAGRLHPTLWLLVAGWVALVAGSALELAGHVQIGTRVRLFNPF